MGFSWRNYECHKSWRKRQNEWERRPKNVLFEKLHLVYVSHGFAWAAASFWLKSLKSMSSESKFGNIIIYNSTVTAFIHCDCDAMRPKPRKKHRKIKQTHGIVVISGKPSCQISAVKKINFVGDLWQLAGLERRVPVHNRNYFKIIKTEQSSIVN